VNIKGSGLLAHIMNLSKNLYVFMLGTLIVFSGCFGTGTTDGEGDDDVGTTVINNYYNNTTEVIYYNNTTEVITELPEMISIGGFKVELDGTTAYFHIINTTAGEMIQIHEANIDDSGTGNNMDFLTNCSSTGAEFNTELEGIGTLEEAHYPGYPSSSGPYYIPGSHTSCTHDLRVTSGAQFSGYDASWSLVYSIVPVTVG